MRSAASWPVTDGLPAMAFAVEPPEPGVMRRAPTPLGESLLGADRGVRIARRGAMPTVLTFVPVLLLWDGGDDAWQTVLFTAIAFAELAGGFGMRSERVSLRRLGLLTNRPLLLAVAVTVLQVLLVAIPFARRLRHRAARRRALADRRRHRARVPRSRRSRQGAPPPCRGVAGARRAAWPRARPFVAMACDLAGDERSARVTRWVVLAALAPSAPLLIMDLGRPARSTNMLRSSSPRALGAANAVVGGYLGSYTGVLLASTAVPLWARSRLFLGPIFVSTGGPDGAAASRLVLTAVVMPAGHPTQDALGRVESGAMAAELLLSEINHRRLGPLGCGARRRRRRVGVPSRQVASRAAAWRCVCWCAGSARGRTTWRAACSWLRRAVLPLRLGARRPLVRPGRRRRRRMARAG